MNGVDSQFAIAVGSESNPVDGFGAQKCLAIGSNPSRLTEVIAEREKIIKINYAIAAEIAVELALGAS